MTKVYVEGKIPVWRSRYTFEVKGMQSGHITRNIIWIR